MIDDLQQLERDEQSKQKARKANQMRIVRSSLPFVGPRSKNMRVLYQSIKDSNPRGSWKKKKNPVAPAATVVEEIFNAAAPLSSDVGASALGASLAAGPKASGGLDLLVVGVGKLASLLGAGGDEGSSVGDSARR
ncbi:Uncharacterized protein Fot_07764 [Forsythia ovata]|uniref:Uncharacterized protein n=1 Tax=Forsythia ovata TaxID=205694 RepID=A0ABD1WWQ9_9LAMI